jgi:hypothetical protein
MDKTDWLPRWREAQLTLPQDWQSALTITERR